MIIWINGPFGGGKSHVAYELNRRIKNSYIFDPEKIGYSIRSNMIHEGELPDFKSYSLWRTSVRYFLDELDRGDRIVIAPMTLTNKCHFEEIITQLKSNHKIIHINLLASKETIEARLLKRGDKKNSWTYKLVDECLNELDCEFFDDRIFTDNLDLYDVVDLIGSKYNLNLSDDKRNRIQKKIGRINTTFKNLRLKEIIFGY